MNRNFRWTKHDSTYIHDDSTINEHIIVRNFIKSSLNGVINNACPPRKRRSGANSKLNAACPPFLFFFYFPRWNFARNPLLVDIPRALDRRASLVSMQITQLRDSNTGEITPFRPRTINLFFRLYDLHGKPAFQRCLDRLFLVNSMTGKQGIIVIQEQFLEVKRSLIVSLKK